LRTRFGPGAEPSALRVATFGVGFPGVGELGCGASAFLIDFDRMAVSFG
jgi:hypothetical protein